MNFDAHLEVHKTGAPPLDRLKIKDSPFYLICGKHHKRGIIPGYFNEENQAVYAYNGKERQAKEFLWVIADRPGKLLVSFFKYCFVCSKFLKIYFL